MRSSSLCRISFLLPLPSLLDLTPNQGICESLDNALSEFYRKSGNHTDTTRNRMLIPKGFSFAAVRAGFKKWDRNDIGLVLCEKDAAAAGVFTLNAFPAAPVIRAKEQLAARQTARAVLMNAGQANACTGGQGLVDCRKTQELAGDVLGLDPDAILPGSTGVIGARMDMAKWEQAAPELKERLGKDDPVAFTRAISTTDRFPKLAWAGVEGADACVLGMAKGAGMICPNMATMLCVILTDADIEPDAWRALLAKAIETTFNRVTVDGDTSTNDTVFGLASGLAGKCPEPALLKAVTEVCMELGKMLVMDGEGAKRIMRVRVTGAPTDRDAEIVARTVGDSPLVKTAIYGQDPNWGRIIMAVGRSGANFKPEEVVVSLAGVEVFRNTVPVLDDVDGVLGSRMNVSEVPIDISLGSGPGECVIYASDLSHDYVSLNADYRT